MNILAPTDFSETSLNALQYAFALAERFDATVTLLYSGDPNEINGKFDELLEQAPVTLKTTIQPNGLLKAVTSYTESNKVDLIVMGTTGASGIKKLIMGSNTVKVMEHVDVPVLVVPSAANYQELQEDETRNNIVLASDFWITPNEDALELVRNIALLFEANEIRLLGVRPKDTQLNPLSKVERHREEQYFSDSIPVARKTVYSDNVLSGINYYLQLKDDIAFVTMVSRKEKGFLQRHLTSEMAFHTELPLLVLRDT